MKFLLFIPVVIVSGAIGCYADANHLFSPPLFWLLGNWSGFISGMIVVAYMNE